MEELDVKTSVSSFKLPYFFRSSFSLFIQMLHVHEFMFKKYWSVTNYNWKCTCTLYGALGGCGSCRRVRWEGVSFRVYAHSRKKVEELTVWSWIIIMASLSSSRVALVTGANQGIGLEIVRQLSKKFDGVVLLAGKQNHQWWCIGGCKNLALVRA